MYDVYREAESNSLPREWVLMEAGVDRAAAAGWLHHAAKTRGYAVRVVRSGAAPTAENEISTDEVYGLVG